MIKKCKIVLLNKECLVAEYDGELIQFPSNQEITESCIYVKSENGKYQLSSENEFLSTAIKNEKIKKSVEENKETKDVIEDDR